MSTRSNPFAELERLFDRMSHQFDEMSRTWTPERSVDDWTSRVDQMAVDLVEHDDEYVATVDLPGFEREEVTIQVTNHTLRIEAEHEEALEEEEEQYLRRERTHKTAKRSIQLPEEVDADAVTATMQNGVLTVTLPRLEVEEPRTIDIE